MLQYCGKLEIYDQPVQIYMLYCTQFFSRLHRSSFFILNARFCVLPSWVRGCAYKMYACTLLLLKVNQVIQNVQCEIKLCTMTICTPYSGYFTFAETITTAKILEKLSLPFFSIILKDLEWRSTKA